MSITRNCKNDEDRIAKDIGDETLEVHISLNRQLINALGELLVKHFRMQPFIGKLQNNKAPIG